MIPLGSLAVLNVNVEKIEDQKMYLSCVTESRDQQTVYAKASGKEDLSPSPWPVLLTPCLEQTEGEMLRIQFQGGLQLFRVGLGPVVQTK